MRKATLVTMAALLSSIPAYAQEAAAAASSGLGDKGIYALGLALMVGLAAFGATAGQGRVGAAAMEGLARNPQARGSMFVMFILALALIESLFILTWLIVAAGMIKI